MISFKVPANPAALRIVAEALGKLAAVFDKPADAVDPCKCVKPAMETTVETGKADDCPSICVDDCAACGEISAETNTEDTTPPAVPPGAFTPPPPAETADTPPELDKEGLPWDQRIHAGSKAINADGTWRVKRNTDPAYVDQIKAELQAAMAAPAPAPEAPQPPVPPAAPGTDDDQPPVSFAGFVQAITKRQSAGTLTVQEVSEACKKHGLASMPLLAARADLIPVVFEELRKIWVTRV